MKKTLCISILLLLTSSLPASAMHDNFDCLTCHNALLVDEQRGEISASDTEVNLYCLSCHDKNRDISGLNTPYAMNNNGETAGGDFIYAALNDNMGHNVSFSDNTLGYLPPGGSSLSSFTCLSCHSSHTNGNYRNLKENINGVPTVVSGLPDANYINNIYISGMNNFCSACHSKFHGTQNTKRDTHWVRHPTGITISQAKHVGFNEWSRIEKPITKVENPDGNVLNKYGAKVFCLSCHYSHASKFDNSMRWDNKTSSAGCYECHSINSLE